MFKAWVISAQLKSKPGQESQGRHGKDLDECDKVERQLPDKPRALELGRVHGSIEEY